MASCGMHCLVTAFIFLLACSFSYSSFSKAMFNRYPFQIVPSSEFISVLKARRVMECSFFCLRSQKCASFNFASAANLDGRYTCQLLSVDRTSHGLSASSSFHHYDSIFTNPCNSSPCKNGGKCSSVSRGRDFSCFCPPSFTGKACQKDKWLKINTSPRCFGTRDDKFASFIIQKTGLLLTMKLVRLNGSITCDTGNPKGWNYWGCLDYSGKHQYMCVLITVKSNSVLLPESGYFIDNKNKLYNFIGYNATSPELVFPKLANPLYVYANQEYRVWFGQDLNNLRESNNGGLVCVDVFGLYE